MRTVACLALAAVLAMPAGTAYAEPRPSLSQAKNQLDKLNKQVDQLVEKYNQVNEDLKAARKKYSVSRAAASREQATFEEMRQKVAEMAATAYKSGDTGDVTGFLATNNPQAVLDQAAVFTHLSENRSSQLSQFLAAAQRMQREQAQAKSAYDQVAKKAKQLREQKQTVEKSITKQRSLVVRLGGAAQSPSGRTGGTYTGPATGSARAALQYAYAQLGKPYQYGAAGPNTFDCSGLTMMAWRAGGVSLPRTTYTQYSASRRVAFDDLQPGDLVFFSGNSHMGISIGNGQMIHAPRTGKNVEIVSISSGYYRQNFYGGGRP
ncbi:C40 family peptidase [Actinomadura sp. HBU206391]|uniref:C40 family peptidase n=1 Tax=Actinomadura sp. HBU206391 TaxID=2731692 RepID=UPI0016502EC8|nr:C40 family peptidase [Actinomadura sp. HBU206391]MBC6462435.1 C40 family peptidase [Actinomadura sp. HBU206391]